GNVRQVGTGKVLKAAHGAAVARTAAPAAPAAYGMDPAVGYGAAPQPGVAGMAQLTNPASYLPGMASALPFAGGSPLSATPSMAQLAAAMPQGGAAAPAGSVPTLSGVQMPEIPVRPTA
ncbi:MAG: hypothetical protein JWM98_2319, partial [Thermoleophilia bacterium]|nr:hypothetical protein [Thermoleophilia bacterium]